VVADHFALWLITMALIDGAIVGLLTCHKQILIN
jgi:hypothetical protein